VPLHDACLPRSCPHAPADIAADIRSRIQASFNRQDSAAAASAITDAGSSGAGSSEAAAAATASVQQASAGKAEAVAESFAAAAARNSAATAVVLARAAAEARSMGATQAFARSQVCGDSKAAVQCVKCTAATAALVSCLQHNAAEMPAALCTTLPSWAAAHVLTL
jgi:hypothetical protein